MKTDYAKLTYVLLPPVLACMVSVSLLQFSYLAFHVVAELFAIIIGFTVLIVGLAARSFNQNHYILFTALVMAWVSGIDLTHTLMYEGMKLFPAENPTIPSQLWLLARSIQAVGLAMAPIYLFRPFKIWKACLALSAVTAVAALTLVEGWFPVTYVAGVGLTPFKVYTEYVIILVFLVAGLLLYLNKSRLSRSVWIRLMAMIVFSIASEFAFTRYVSAYGQANMVGHLLKILAYWALYLALIDNSLNRPFDMLAKTVSSYDALPFAIITVGPEHRILQANATATQWAGASREYLIDKDSHALFHDVHLPADHCPVCTHQAGPNTTQVFEIPVKHGARRLECSATQVKNADGQFVQIQILREMPSATA